MKPTITRLTTVYLSLMVIYLVFTAPSVARIDAQSVVGMWLFDEGTGDTTRDISPHGHDGEIKGSIKWVEGKIGSALQFPGLADSYVLIPHDDTFNLVTFSITAWVNLKDKGAYHGLVEKVEGGTRNFYMAIYPDDKAFYGGFRANNAWNSALTKSAVLDERWHHLAVTYDQKHIRGYVNGEMEDEQSFNLKPETNNGPLTIGVTGTGGAEPTLGIIDEVGLFNDALTELDVKNIMTSGLKIAVSAVSNSGKLATTWAAIKSSREMVLINANGSNWR